MSQSIDRGKEIFQEALALPSAQARSDHLAAACGSDEPLHHEIEALLRPRRRPGLYSDPIGTLLGRRR
jgi:hypothetical protein